MAEHFQTGGTCSSSWWSTARIAAVVDGTVAIAPTLSCSTTVADIGCGGGGFSWAAAAAVELPETNAFSGEDPAGSCSGSSVTQASDMQPSATTGGDGQFINISGFGLSSPGAVDWNQAFLNSGSCGGATAAATEDYMNHNLLLDQHHLSSSEPAGFPIAPSPTSYNCLTSTLLQSFLESDNSPPMNYRSPQPACMRFPHLIKNRSPPPPPAAADHLRFLNNNTSFWNGPATDLLSAFHPPATSQFATQPSFDQKAQLFSALTSKANTDQVGREKKGSSEPCFKKPRIETPSPLPTFKVRKEKLGDRITALQQLVSPFGKTDTASVLHEAIEYIKFLHEQVGVLSTPYLKNGHPMQIQKGPCKLKADGPKQDLRSRGLCLVPITSTFPVASETPADFWTATFGGTYV